MSTTNPTTVMSPTLMAVEAMEAERKVGVPVFKSEFRPRICGKCFKSVRVVRYDSPDLFVTYYTCFKCGAEERHGREKTLTDPNYGYARERLENRKDLTVRYNGAK